MAQLPAQAHPLADAGNGCRHLVATHAAAVRAPSADHVPPASKAATARVNTASSRSSWRCRATTASPSPSTVGSTATASSSAAASTPIGSVAMLLPRQVT